MSNKTRILSKLASERQVLETHGAENGVYYEDLSTGATTQLPTEVEFRKNSTILAVETSCDETAVAVVNSNKQVLAHEILSQTEHKTRGGVIPEVASRAHMNHLSSLIKNAIEKSNLNFCELDAIAATSGPGLIGGLIVGTMMAKAIAHVAKKPFIAVNHLEAHALVIRLLHEVKFPFLVLLISGGHCQFLIAQDVGKYIKLGETLDDSLGEAFDKVAKMLGLDYPGGPLIEKLAKKGDGTRFKLPRAMIRRSGCNFSFSGIKTAVKNLVQKLAMSEQDVCDVCASFQECISDILLDRVSNAIIMAESLNIKIHDFVITGGVAANNFLRTCSQSFEQQNSKCQNYHLQAGIELSFTVFPQPPAFIQPSKGPLHNPSFRQYNKFVQLISLSHLHTCANNFLNLSSEIFSRIASINQDIFDF